MTLHFIGSVDLPGLPALADAVDLPMEPFDLLLDTPRSWPRGLAVLEAARLPAALSRLHRRLGESLQRLGLPVEERTYRPHVTFARRAAGAVGPKEAAPVKWAARSFALVVSTGNRQQRYQVLREYPRAATRDYLA